MSEARTAEPAPAEPGPSRPPAGRGQEPDPDRPLSWRGWVLVGLAVICANVALLHHLFRVEAPVTVAGPRFEDDFNRGAIGGNYFTTGMHWRIAQGWLWAPEAKNNPLWLEMRLPREVAVEFDVHSDTAVGDRQGDIKFEIFGDGRNHASGYVCVFGGWGNQISVIARLDEHGKDRHERRDRKVEPRRIYHMRVERRGGLLSWFVDGAKFLEFNDPQPLSGKGHDRFGFSSWEADVFFDNLKIEPLP